MVKKADQGSNLEKWGWDDLTLFLDQDHTVWSVDEAMAIIAGLKPGNETEKPLAALPRPRNTAQYCAELTKRISIAQSPESILIAERRANCKKYKDRWRRTRPKETADSDQFLKREIFINWAITNRIEIPWLLEAENLGFFSLEKLANNNSKYLTKKEKIIIEQLLKSIGIGFDNEGIPSRGAQKFLVNFMEKEGISIDKGTVSSFFKKCFLVSTDN